MINNYYEDDASVLISIQWMDAYMLAQNDRMANNWLLHRILKITLKPSRMIFLPVIYSLYNVVFR